MIPGFRLLLRLCNTRRCTRRAFLLSALFGLTAGRTRYSLADDEPEPCVIPQWLQKTIPSQKSAARLGLAYLDEHPQHRHCHRLIKHIEQTLNRQDAAVSPKSDASRIAALQQLVRNEYLHDEVVSVTGWILSKTEARLYALAAMIE